MSGKGPGHANDGRDGIASGAADAVRGGEEAVALPRQQAADNVRDINELGGDANG